MTGKWNPSSAGLKSGKAGTTLVEVVAGLALLAALLTAVLLGKSRFSRQSRLAERRHEAVLAADALLCDWWRDVRQFPRSAAGVTSPGFAWRTRPVRDPGAERLGGQVVRLEVTDVPGAGGAGGVGAALPLVRVDVVLPAGSDAGPVAPGAATPQAGERAGRPQ